MTPTLTRALAVAELGLAVLDLDLDIEAKDRGEPAAAPVPGRELANPFGLPAGTPIRKALVRFFRRQLARILGGLPRDPLAEVPAAFDVTDWTDEMADAMTPVIRPYWDRGGKRLYAEVGLDPKSWSVVSPKLAPKIREQTFHFVDSTNKSTTLRLQAAHAELRSALDEGLVERGESLGWLTRRVNGIYTGLTRSHASLIASTEASRATHLAQEAAAIESEVVAGWSWQLSSDACYLCKRIASKAKHVRLGQPFAVIGDHEYYSEVRMPPGHPKCMCTVLSILLPEHGGPDDVQWGETLRGLPEAGKSFSFPDDLDARLAGLEAKYRACRDRRGRFASCGGGGGISQDIAHIRGRSGRPTKPGRYDKETAAATLALGGGQQMVDPVAAETAVAAVRAGTARLLGRGSEGATYQVGDLIVKHNKRDGSDLAEAARVANEMRAAGVPGLPPYHIVGDGKDAATVRPAYDIPDRLTLPQLEQNRATLRAMHERGYTLNDEFVDNVGVDRAGNALLIDTGYARKVQDGPLPEGRRHNDLENLRAFYAFQLDPARRPYRTNRPPDHPAYRDLEAEVARAGAAGKSLPGPDDLETKRACRDRRGRFASCGSGGPLADRLAAYHAGDRKVAALAAAGGRVGEARAEVDRVGAEHRAALADLLARAPTDADLIRLRDSGDPAVARYRELGDRLKAAEAAHAEAQAGVRAELARALAVPDPLTWDHDVATTGRGALGPDQVAAVAGARAVLDRAVAAPPGGGDAPGTAPIGWARVPAREEQRAHYDEDAGAVRLTRADGAATAAHEWGHAVEHRVPGVREAAHEFLAHRLGDERPRPLAGLFPKDGYGADEEGRKDRFDAHFPGAQAYYVGKTYEGGATEVVAMGVEALFRDPAGFAKHDPEYTKFTLGILDGSLR